MERAGIWTWRSVQAHAIGVATFGEDRVVDYETQTHWPRSERLDPRSNEHQCPHAYELLDNWCIGKFHKDRQTMNARPRWQQGAWQPDPLRQSGPPRRGRSYTVNHSSTLGSIYQTLRATSATLWCGFFVEWAPTQGSALWQQPRAMGDCQREPGCSVLRCARL